MPLFPVRSCVLLLALPLSLAGCIGSSDEDGVLAGSGGDPAPTDLLPIQTGVCVAGTGGPPPPEGEEVVGLQPIQMIFGGSIRHTNTRVALIPPTHGDLGSPTNSSRSGLEYLAATLEGIFNWEPVIDQFIVQHPEFSYLDEVTVQVELLEQEPPETAGYDIVIDYVETSGPLFRGVAIYPGFDPQPQLDDAGAGDIVHFSNRYVLLSLFAYSERAGQTQPDFPETHEMRGVTMHEFAHVWGLGHSVTWTPGCGGDLMNSPYPYIYGDGDPVGDGGERTRPLCISSLDMFGLAYLYRWVPTGEWEGSEGEVSLPETMVYEEYCEPEGAAERAKAVIDAQLTPALRERLGWT